MEKQKNAKVFDDNYKIINSVVINKRSLEMNFADGDKVKVSISEITPNKLKKIAKWEKAVITADGLSIKLESNHDICIVPWDVIRILTDPKFAKNRRENAAMRAEQIGKHLKELREMRGFTQKRIAKIAGIALSTLQQVENENAVGKIKISELWQILAALRCTPANLSI